MTRCRLPGFALASLLGLAAIIGFVHPSPAVAQAAQVQWNGVERVVAFADVHGAYTELVTLLRETGIVDARDRWAAGQTHVVSLGDLLDRGADSRKVMDLLMRLQGEAQSAGGQRARCAPRAHRERISDGHTADRARRPALRRPR